MILEHRQFVDQFLQTRSFHTHFLVDFDDTIVIPPPNTITKCVVPEGGENSMVKAPVSEFCLR